MKIKEYIDNRINEILNEKFLREGIIINNENLNLSLYPKFKKWIEKLRTKGFDIEVSSHNKGIIGVINSGEYKNYTVGRSSLMGGHEYFISNNRFNKR